MSTRTDRNTESRQNAARAAVQVLARAERNGAPILDAFAAEGGTVRDLGPARGHQARLHGFSATCTSSACGAVHNWRRQVIVKLGEIA